MRWNGSTVAVIAAGPSLTPEDAAYAREHSERVIVINESWRLCPGADVLYAADCKWWINRGPAPEAFRGERWTQQAQWTEPFPEGMNVIESHPGHSVYPPGAKAIFTGHNSGFQAMGLAVIWGARKIVFLGLDLCAPKGGPNHWHGEHPAPLSSPAAAYPGFIKAFTRAAPQLAPYGVTVINASRRTALECFPRVALEEALP